METCWTFYHCHSCLSGKTDFVKIIKKLELAAVDISNNHQVPPFFLASLIASLIASHNVFSSLFLSVSHVYIVKRKDLENSLASLYICL